MASCSSRILELAVRRHACALSFLNSLHMRLRVKIKYYARVLQSPLLFGSGSGSGSSSSSHLLRFPLPRRRSSYHLGLLPPSGPRRRRAHAPNSTACTTTTTTTAETAAAVAAAAAVATTTTAAACRADHSGWVHSVALSWGRGAVVEACAAAAPAPAEIPFALVRALRGRGR